MTKIKPIIIHPFDPFGTKIGGIETFIRNFIKYAPGDFDIELVGATSQPRERPTGSWQAVNLGGKRLRFFPVIYVKDENLRTRIPLSLRFNLGILTYKRRISLDHRILEFHRIEPMLAFQNKNEMKFLYLHSSSSNLYNAHNESRWKKVPWLYLHLEKRLINRAENLFAVEEETAQFYSASYPNISKKIFFIPNGVNENVFYPYPLKAKRHRKSKVLKNFQFDLKDKLILFAGRLEDQKDPMLLIDAFISLRKQANNTKLLIAGTGTEEKKMKRKLEDHGLIEDVKFLGIVSQMKLAELMRISDVFLFTSAFEAMPMAVLEAQACGLPVVSTDVGEVRRIVKNGISGETVTQRSSEILAKKALSVIAHPERYSISNCAERITPFLAADMLGKVYDRHYSR